MLPEVKDNFYSAHFLHRAHGLVLGDAGTGLFSRRICSNYLLIFWDLGRPVALGITVVSLLNPSTLVGAVLEVTENRRQVLCCRVGVNPSIS